MIKPKKSYIVLAATAQVLCFPNLSLRKSFLQFQSLSSFTTSCWASSFCSHLGFYRIRVYSCSLFFLLNRIIHGICIMNQSLKHWIGLGQCLRGYSCLFCKHENLISNPQSSCKKTDMAEWPWNPCLVGAERVDLKNSLASLAKMVVFWYRSNSVIRW